MNSEKFPKVLEMSDAALAKGIIADTFDLTPGRRSIVIGLAIAALKRVERALEKSDPKAFRSRPRQWTERRVRSIVDEEARRIDAYEIEDLRRVAIAEAREDYKRSTQRAARLAAFLSHQDEDFHGPQIAFQSALARGLARSGDPVASRAAGGVGSTTDRGSEQPRGMDRAGDSDR